MKKSYDFIDFWKLFFAVSVVALHTGAFRDCKAEISFTLFSLFSRLAVPFFFCAGGFFLFSKWRNSKISQFQVATKQAKRVLILYGIWTCIKFLYCIGRAILQGNAITAVASTYVMNMLALSDGPYWYLQVQIIMTLLLGWFCTTEKKTCIATVCFSVCYVLFLGLRYIPSDSQLPILSGLRGVISANDFLFKLIVGGLFLTIGGCISYWQEKVVSPNVKKELLHLTYGMLLLVLEIGFIFYIGRTDYDKISYFFALPLIAAALLKICVTVPIFLKRARLWRNLSILIYLTHYMTRGLVGYLANYSYFIYFLATLSISVCVSLMMIKLSEKYQAFRWLY